MKRPLKFKADDRKLEELILLIALRSEGDETFGSVKLNKLLFFCDFTAYVTRGKPITGHEYYALQQGPAPRSLMPVTNKMQARKELAFQKVDYYGLPQKRPIALRSPRLDVFDAEEISLIERTIARWRSHNATEISATSHIFIGWKIAQLKETIPYPTALVGNRPPTPDEERRGLELQARAVALLRQYAAT